MMLKGTVSVKEDDAEIFDNIMGHNFSVIQKIRALRAIDESDDESDDDEHWEVEVDKSSRTELDTHDPNCNTDASLYISVEDLISRGNDSLNKLPEDIRHESVLEYISVQEKFVVRIQVNHGNYWEYGTGCANISTTKEVEEHMSCPLLNCKHNNGQPHKCYGGLLVYTNKHVIQNISQAQSCKVAFFYYNLNSLPNDGQVTEINQDESLVDGDKQEVNSLNLDVKDANANGHTCNCDTLPKCVTAYGISLRENMQHKDLAGLRILYHDRELYNTVKRYSDLKSGAWSKIPSIIKSRLKEYVIIISHPHGWPKKVSFGNLVCLEENDKNENHRKVTRYTAATCRGSSGAPVLTGHYPKRPFVHSSKASITNFGASFSY